MISSEQVSILRNWNNAVKHGCTEQSTFNKIIANADDNTKTYFSGLNKGKASLDGLKNAQNVAKTSTIGLTVATTALNMAISFGIVAAISLAVKGIDKLVNAQENAIAKADEAISNFEEQRTSLQNNKSTIDEISSDYAKLSQGVDSLGRNISLNSEEYSKYNEIVNKIADMFPQMIQGYTEEGNAIIVNKGNVAELTKAYEAQKKAAQDAIIVGSADTFKGYKSKVNYDANVSWEEPGLIQEKNFIESLMDVIDDKDALVKFLDDTNAGVNEFNGVIRDAALKTAGIKLGIHWDTDGTAKELQSYKQTLKSEINTITTEINTETAKIKPIMTALMEQSSDYQSLDPDVQDMVSQIVGQFDSSFYSQFDNEIDMADWVTDNIVNKFKGVDGSKISDAFSNAINLKSQLQNGDITLDDYLKGVSEFKTLIDGFDDNTKKSVDLIFNVTSTDGVSTDALVNNVKEKLQDKFDGKVGELNLGDLEIAANLEVPDGVTLSWDELIAKIQEYKDNLENANGTSHPFSDAISQVQALSAGLDQLDKIYADVYDKEGFDWSSILNNDNFKEEFGEMGESYDNFIKQISETPDDLSACQESFNKLASDYLYNSEVLGSQLTPETAKATSALLQQMGISNADIIVTEVLAQRKQDLANTTEYAALTGKDLANATVGEINNLVTEGKITSEVAEQMQLLAFKKQWANKNAITTAGDIRNLAELATASSKLTQLLNALASAKDAVAHGAPSQAYASQISSLESQINDYVNGSFGNNTNPTFAGGVSTKSAIDKANKSSSGGYATPSANKESNKSSSGGSKSASKTKFKGEIDWAENTISNLENRIDILNAKLSDSDSYAKRLKYVKQILEAEKSLQKIQKKAISKYKTEYKDELKSLSKRDRSKYQNLIQSQKSVNIQTFSGNEKQYNKVVDAQKAWNTYQDANKKYLDTVNAVHDREIALIDETIKWRNNYQDLLDRKADSLNEKLESGYSSAFDVKSYKKNRKNKISSTKKEKLDLTKQLKHVQKYSDKWYEIKDKIAECDDEIKECNRSILEAPIRVLEKQLDTYQKELETVKKLKDTQSDYVDAITYGLNKQIDSLNDTKDAMSDYYDSMINPLQEQLDILQKTNDQRERTIALQKAQAELERLKQQKTVKVMRNGQWNFEADESKLNDAQDAYDNASYNKTVGDLQDKIDSINKQKENSLKIYDVEIEKIQQIIDKFGNIISDAEMQNKLDSLYDNFGKNVINMIISGDKTVFDDISSKVENIQTEIDNLSSAIDHTQMAVDTAKEYVEMWSAGGITISKAQKKISSSISDATSVNMANINAQTTTFTKDTNAVNKNGSAVRETTNITNRYSETISDIIDNGEIIQMSDHFQLLTQSLFTTANAYREAQAALAAYQTQQRASMFSSTSSSSSNSKSQSNKSSGSSKTKGSSHSNGTSNARGGISLVSEEAPELIVDKTTGTFELVSEPTLRNLKHGDIVFNGAETEEILKKANGLKTSFSGNALFNGQNQIDFTKFISPTTNLMQTPKFNLPNLVPKNENKITHLSVDKFVFPGVKNENDAQKFLDGIANKIGNATMQEKYKKR